LGNKGCRRRKYHPSVTEEPAHAEKGDLGLIGSLFERIGFGLHLLFFGHPLADHLVHSRFDKTRADPFAVAVTFAIVRGEGSIPLDVAMELIDCLE
jgi:hypothetical protein